MGVTSWKKVRSFCMYPGEAIKRSIKRARHCVCAEGSGGGGAPGTVNRLDAATARRSGSSTAAPYDPVTAADRSAGVALAQGGVRLLSLGYHGWHGTLVA